MISQAEINTSRQRISVGIPVLLLSACGPLIIDGTGQVDTSTSKREDFEQCMMQLNQSYQKIMASCIKDCRGDETCKLGAPDWNDGQTAAMCKVKFLND